MPNPNCCRKEPAHQPISVRLFLWVKSRHYWGRPCRVQRLDMNGFNLVGFRNNMWSLNMHTNFGDPIHNAYDLLHAAQGFIGAPAETVFQIIHAVGGHCLINGDGLLMVKLDVSNVDLHTLNMILSHLRVDHTDDMGRNMRGTASGLVANKIRMAARFMPTNPSQETQRRKERWQNPRRMSGCICGSYERAADCLLGLRG